VVDLRLIVVVAVHRQKGILSSDLAAWLTMPNGNILITMSRRVLRVDGTS